MFESLVESILGQQLAGAAAEAIIKRVRALYVGGRLQPRSMYSTPVSKLRSAGVSPQKARYLKDLSSRIVKKQLDLELLKEKSDEELTLISGRSAWHRTLDGTHANDIHSRTRRRSPS